MGNFITKYDCDWDAEIEAFQTSGKTLQEFSEDKEYSLGAFTYHYYKNRNRETGSDVNEILPAFLPVEIVSADNHDNNCPC